jgi:hypothetical protein
MRPAAWPVEHLAHGAYAASPVAPIRGVLLLIVFGEGRGDALVRLPYRAGTKVLPAHDRYP